MTILPFNIKKKSVLSNTKLQTDLEFQRKVMWQNTDSLLPAEKEKLLSHCLEEITILNQANNENCRKIGEILETAKQQLPHGKFCKWVSTYCPFSHRAALNMMKMYRTTLDYPGLLNCKKSVIYLIGSKSFDGQLRKQMELAAGCYDIKHKEVLQLKVALDNGDIASDSVKVDDYFKKRKELDLKERLEGEDKRIINTLKKLKDGYNDFIQGHKKIIGGRHDNEFVMHSRHSIKVLDQAIKGIRQGHKNNTAALSEEQQNPVQSESNHMVPNDKQGLLVMNAPLLLPYFPGEEEAVG